MRAEVATEDRKLFQRGRGLRACFYDANKMEPDFTDTPVLKKFISERGKIVPAAKSGVCAKHQRLLTRAIKQSRQLGLLPYLNR